MKECYLYKKPKDKKVQCQTCAHQCVIEPGNRGVCGVRENQDGQLYLLVYGRAIAANIDPIEKKPFFHFLPGSQSFSVATVGCNFRCNNCFTPGAFITTKNGVMPIENIFESGENEYQKADGAIVKEIKNYSTINHKGEYSKILRGFKHQYKGEIISIKPYYTPPIKCTPYHEIFVTTNPFTEQPKKIQAQEINKNHYLAIPKFQSLFESTKPITIDIKKILTQEPLSIYKVSRRKVKEKEFDKFIKVYQNFTSKKLGQIFNLHPAYVRAFRGRLKKPSFNNINSLFYRENEIIELAGKIKFKTEKNPFIPRYIKLDKKLATLFGYYCAEGCVHKLTNRPNSLELIFTFSKKEKQKIKEIDKLIKEIFGLQTSIETRKSTIALTVYKSSVATLFKTLCGHGARTKKIPSLIYQADKETISSFLKAYFEGDGWVNKQEIAINTVSKNLAFGIYFLLLRLGILPAFHEWKSVPWYKIEGRIVKQAPLYYVKIRTQKSKQDFLSKVLKSKVLEFTKSSKHKGGNVKFIENDYYWFLPIFNITKEKYDGPVYNLEVEKEHSYLANFISVANCQNWDISQGSKQAGITSQQIQKMGFDLPPEKIVQEALDNDCPSISYTYTSPTIFLEYALDTMKLAKKKGLKNNWVSNGFMSKETLELIVPYLDAINVDLKSFSDDFYIKNCGARLQPVLDSLKRIKEKGIWLEVTTLVIPTLSDSKEMFEQIANFIKNELGPETPWHVTQFSGLISWQLQHLPETPIKTLEKACQIGLKAGLKYVYSGNVPGLASEDTYCPKCQELNIDRTGYRLVRFDKDGKCYKCGANLNLVLK